MLTPEQWHTHFCYQAKWTEQVRKQFFNYWSGQNPKILEVGCGTGAIIGSILLNDQKNLFGLDFSLDLLRYFSKNANDIHLTSGNAYYLPFCHEIFDITFCHFLLLWLNDPLAAMNEMVRVTRKGGWVAAFAEPDHEARIDYPNEFEKAGKAQVLSLQRQGADLKSGRKLAEIMLESGLQNVQVGILGANWLADRSVDHTAENKMLNHDMEWLSDEERSNVYLKVDEIDSGKRVVFVPTFYAWGQV